MARLQENQKELLSTQWLKTLKTLNLDPAAGQKDFQTLIRHYQESGRHYHNLAHIQALLGWLDQYRSELKDPELVALAIWYHDAIYSTLRKDNEARSASLAEKSLKALGLEDAARQKVSLLIRQTASHLGEPLTQDPDLAWFLDFDLSILGCEEKVYYRYAEQIRKEYRLIPDILYRNGRSKLLRTLLKAPFLYQTPTFRRSHERQARSNLLNELRRLDATEALGLD